MTPRLHDDLERDARRFDALGGRDLGLDEVLGKAHGIRRRRRATALVAVAAVAAAIAVPSVLLTRSHERTTPDPAHRLPTIDRIGLSALPVGDKPKTGWLDGKTWHSDGHAYALGSALPGEARNVAQIGHDLLVSVFDDRLNLHAYRLPLGDHDSEAPGQLGAMTGGFATSPKGHVVAFAGIDGRVVTVQDGDTTTLSGLPSPGAQSSYDAVAVSGENCSSGHQCAVWVNDSGRKPRVLTAVTPGMDLGPMPRILLLRDVSGEGMVAGLTKVTDGASCSEVQEDAKALWTTCDAQFDSFSPDGKHLLGTMPYFDGLGTSELKTFDAKTGTPGLDLQTAEGATITQMRWEDDDHVLAVVYEGNRWGVLRIGLDRTVEYAIAPVAGNDVDGNPFLLPD
jgi:hypothetical protein